MWSSGKDATWLASNEIPEVWWDLEQRLQLSQPGFQTQGNWENKCLFFLVASFEVVFMQHRKPIGYCSVAKLCPTLATSWIAAHQAPLSSNTYCSCSDSCPLCRWCSLSHPLLSPSPPAFNLSQHLGLSNELALCIRWPKYWSFNFSINLSKEHSGLISFRFDCFDLLTVWGTLKSLL